MTQLASAAALLLAALFVWAAQSKLRRPLPTAAAFAALGIPWAAALARLVPLLELGTAATLLVRPRPGAVAAAVLLVAFTAVLARALAASEGVTIRCGCFGSAGDAPVSAITLLRNGFLLTAAALAAGTTSFEPGTAGVLALGAAGVTALVVLALAELHRTTGHLFPSPAATAASIAKVAVSR